MHNVARKAGWWFECARKAVKDTDLPYPSLQVTRLIFGVGQRGYDTVQAFSVLQRVNWGEVGDVNIWVSARRVRYTERSKQGQVIMSPLWFVTPNKIAEKLAASPAMMANRAA